MKWNNVAWILWHTTVYLPGSYTKSTCAGILLYKFIFRIMRFKNLSCTAIHISVHNYEHGKLSCGSIDKKSNDTIGRCRILGNLNSFYCSKRSYSTQMGAIMSHRSWLLIARWLRYLYTYLYKWYLLSFRTIERSIRYSRKTQINFPTRLIVLRSAI